MGASLTSAADYLEWTSALSTDTVASFACLVKATPHTYGQLGMLAQRWNQGTSRNGWALSLEPSAGDALRLIAYSSSSLQVDFNTGVSFDDGLLHSVVLLTDGASGAANHIYVDNILAASGNSSASWTQHPSLRLGDPGQSFWTDGFRGEVSEVGVWNGVHLNTQEIAMLHARVSPMRVRPDALGLYAPIVRNSNSRITRGSVTSSGIATTPHPRVVGGMA